MDRNLLKPLIAVVAAAAGLGIWQFARASSPPAPPFAQMTQIDGGAMPADHASHHMANAGSANIFTGTLPYMGAMMNSAGAGDMMKLGDMSAMMGSTDMSAMMGSTDMSAMMNSANMNAMMNSANMNAMMNSANMNAMMNSANMNAMMDSANMNAMMDSAGMIAADKQACLDAAGDGDKMQAHMARMSAMPDHMQPDTEPAK